MHNQLDAQSISKVMSVNEEKVKIQIDRIINNNKQPIPGAVKYKKPEGEKQQYILPFDHASLSLDDNSRLIKDFDKNHPLGALYCGQCTCKHPSNRTVNLLVLGQTGAGKTTLVDSFANHVLGIERYDKFRYKLVDARNLEEERHEMIQKAQGEDADKSSIQAISQTSKVSIYHIPSEHIVNGVSQEKHCINIIDTPGFGDTRGIVWDYKIFEMIKGCLTELQTLDYISLVVKASENRLASSSKHVYIKIQNLYADDLSERILGMFTFSDGAEPQGYIAVTAEGIEMAEKFKFNNSAMWSDKDSPTTRQFYKIGE